MTEAYQQCNTSFSVSKISLVEFEGPIVYFWIIDESNSCKRCKQGLNKARKMYNNINTIVKLPWRMEEFLM